MFSKLKEKAVSSTDETSQKAKEFLLANKEKVKSKLSENEEVKKLIIDKVVEVASIAVIAVFLYELLPAPVRWVVSEDDFVQFTTENIDFIFEALS